MLGPSLCLVDAVEAYRRQGHSIDAVVMDVTMPNLNGPEAANQMKVVDPDVRVLLMSAYNLEHMRTMWQDTCADFLPKPFSMREFLSALRRVLDTPASSKSREKAGKKAGESRESRESRGRS
jgi:DNA-binding NtrC family response regulator